MCILISYLKTVWSLTKPWLFLSCCRTWHWTSYAFIILWYSRYRVADECQKVWNWQHHSIKFKKKNLFPLFSPFEENFMIYLVVIHEYKSSLNTCLCWWRRNPGARLSSRSCGGWGWRGRSTWGPGGERAPLSGDVISEHEHYHHHCYHWWTLNTPGYCLDASPVKKLFRNFRVTMNSENEKLESTHIVET